MNQQFATIHGPAVNEAHDARLVGAQIIQVACNSTPHRVRQAALQDSGQSFTSAAQAATGQVNQFGNAIGLQGKK
jgi:hypothetical protein